MSIELDIYKQNRINENNAIFNSNVSRLYSNPEPLLNAREMNKEYNYQRENKVARLAERFYL